MNTISNQIMKAYGVKPIKTNGEEQFKTFNNYCFQD